MPRPAVLPEVRQKGTYLVLVPVPDTRLLAFGRAREARLEQGTYCYVGSALGPGGLAARLRRHHRAGTSRHWHVDALLADHRLAGVLVIASGDRIECDVASWVRRRAPVQVVGFGASDCRCSSHLFRVADDLEATEFISAAQTELAARHLTRHDLAALLEPHGSPVTAQRRRSRGDAEQRR